MFDGNIQQQLQAAFLNLKQEVVLTASLDESDAANEMRQFLDEVVALAPEKLSLKFNGHFVRKPSFSIAKAGENPRVHFAAIPMGHEFTTFVLALLQVSGHPPKISDETAEFIKNLKIKARFELFVSLSCHNCPEVAQAIHILAALNDNVETVMIDGGLFQNEIESRQIMGVPSLWMNGENLHQGRITLDELLQKLDSSRQEKALEKLENQGTLDLLVVGAGPAGAAAAVYAARKGLNVAVLASRIGGQIMDTLTIENFISVLETEGPKLAAALEAHMQKYNVPILLGTAEKLEKTEKGFAVQLTGGKVLNPRSVILACGAKWRDLNVEGETAYRARGICFCPHCDGPLFKGKDVAVIGGGNSGVEAAIDLAGIVKHVTLLEFDSQMRADTILQEKLKSLPNVTIHTNAQTLEVLGDGEKLTGILWQDRNSQQKETLALSGLFVQIGLVPNTAWLKGTLNLNNRGEIETNAKGETSLNGVFAAGDCTTQTFKQIIISMGSGATASLGAFEYLTFSP